MDARLSDGSRVNAVYKNVALNGPILTIRKFPERAMTMDDLMEKGTLDRQLAEFLKKLVAAGYQLLHMRRNIIGKDDASQRAFSERAFR